MSSRGWQYVPIGNEWSLSRIVGKEGGGGTAWTPCCIALSKQGAGPAGVLPAQGNVKSLRLRGCAPA
jgi:hypothetical protein